MMDEEPSRYRSLTGGIVYGAKPFDSQIFDDMKQCEDPESRRARNRELNPDAIRFTRDGDMDVHESEPEGRTESGTIAEEETST
jgi:hypothetical protein